MIIKKLFGNFNSEQIIRVENGDCRNILCFALIGYRIYLWDKGRLIVYLLLWKFTLFPDLKSFKVVKPSYFKTLKNTYNFPTMDINLIYF